MSHLTTWPGNFGTTLSAAQLPSAHVKVSCVDGVVATPSRAPTPVGLRREIRRGRASAAAGGADSGAGWEEEEHGRRSGAGSEESNPPQNTCRLLEEVST